MWKRIKIYPYSPVDVIRRGSNKKELIWMKTNTEKRADKVLPGKIFILINFKENVFTYVNSQQLRMNFNMFSSSSRVHCAIQINFNLDTVDKGWKLLYCKRHPSD